MLPEELKNTIQSAYSSFLASSDFRARYCQRLMIAEVARSLSATPELPGEQSAVAVVEAGTGTGKTVAYVMAALPLAQAAEKTLVISTATVALQEQIVFKDLPDISERSGLAFDWTLAKGRRRYLCLSRLDQLLRSDTASQSLSFFEDEVDAASHSAADRKLGEEMLSRLSGGDWDGERDSWPVELDNPFWFQVSTDYAQCSGRRCSFYENCVFYRAREQVHRVDCIVANHDLVLSDLLSGGGNVLPPVEDCVFVFDEAHHLAAKAGNHLSARVALEATQQWLAQIPAGLENMLKETGPLGRFPGALPELDQLIGHHVDELRLFAVGLQPYAAEVDRDSGVHRFVRGDVGVELRDRAMDLRTSCERIASVIGGLKSALDDEAQDGAQSDLGERWAPLVASMLVRLESALSLWRGFARADRADDLPMARWLRMYEGEVELHIAPISVATEFAELLWTQAHGAVLTSATLSVGGDFSQLLSQLGLEADTHSVSLQSPFDFANKAVLAVPECAVDPRDDEAHTTMLIDNLPQLLDDGGRGSLVLFNSWRQLFAVYEGLPEAWQAKILRQGAHSRTEIVRLHRERIDRGDESCIFGVASFAEGIDLPGRYCDHVVITRIPFSVPNDPVGATLGEWIEARGGNSFAEIMMPNAALRLVQACGRLLRTEEDSGRVTILDRRLVSQRYGAQLLAALPPFRRELARP